jgi:hypothetical protein
MSAGILSSSEDLGAHTQRGLHTVGRLKDCPASLSMTLSQVATFAGSGCVASRWRTNSSGTIACLGGGDLCQ